VRTRGGYKRIANKRKVAHAELKGIAFVDRGCGIGGNSYFGYLHKGGVGCRDTQVNETKRKGLM
jgi:hypothetical protein